MMARPEIAALAALLRTARTRGLEVLVIGAFAREQIVDVPYGGQAYRATTDVDTAVHVKDWESYRGLVAALLQEAGFLRIDEHRIRHDEGTYVDLLPFGGVADEQGNLSWEDADRTLSLAGLEAAAVKSQEVIVDGLAFRVPSVAGFIGLKLFAFRDRGHLGSTDLGDLTYILHGSSEQLVEDGRLYQELPAAVIEALDFDQLGPSLLGRELAAMLRSGDRTELLGIIDTRILVAPDFRALTLTAQFGSTEQRVRWFEALRAGLSSG